MIRKQCGTCVNWVGVGYIYGCLTDRKCRIVDYITNESDSCNAWEASGMYNAGDYKSEMAQLLEQLPEVLRVMQELMKVLDKDKE